jgi:hypothetical protein
LPDWTVYLGSVQQTDILEDGLTLFGLDDIAFSTTVVAPEPNMARLSAMGGLLFGARKWFARRC